MKIDPLKKIWVRLLAFYSRNDFNGCIREQLFCNNWGYFGNDLQSAIIRSQNNPKKKCNKESPKGVNFIKSHENHHAGLEKETRVGEWNK